MSDEKKPFVSLELVQAPTLLGFVPIFFGRKEGGKTDFVVRVPLLREEGTFQNCTLSVYMNRLAHGPVYDGYQSTNWHFGGTVVSTYREIPVEGSLEYLFDDFVKGQIEVRRAVQRMLLAGKL